MTPDARYNLYKNLTDHCRKLLASGNNVTANGYKLSLSDETKDALIKYFKEQIRK